MSSLSIPSSSYTASGVLQRPCMSMLWHWVPLQNSPGLQSLQQRSPEKYSLLLQSKWFSFCLEGRSEQTLLSSWKKIRDILRLLVTAEGGQIMVEKGHTKKGAPLWKAYGAGIMGSCAVERWSLPLSGTGCTTDHCKVGWLSAACTEVFPSSLLAAMSSTATWDLQGPCHPNIRLSRLLPVVGLQMEAPVGTTCKGLKESGLCLGFVCLFVFFSPCVPLAVLVLTM